MARPRTGSPSYPPAKLRALREQEARRAVVSLGLPPQNLYFMRAADTRLPAEGAEFEAYVQWLGAIGHRHGCSLVLAPWQADPHCDHETSAFMAASIVAQTGWALLSYPVWGGCAKVLNGSMNRGGTAGGWRYPHIWSASARRLPRMHRNMAG